jgi:hypothetical protein
VAEEGVCVAVTADEHEGYCTRGLWLAAGAVRQAMVSGLWSVFNVRYNLSLGSSAGLKSGPGGPESAKICFVPASGRR